MKILQIYIYNKKYIFKTNSKKQCFIVSKQSLAFQSPNNTLKFSIVSIRINLLSMLFYLKNCF